MELLLMENQWNKRFLEAGARFLKAPIINGPVKLVLFTSKIEGFNTFASNMVKLSFSETEWSKKGKTVWMQMSTERVNITDWFLLPDL